MCQLDQVNTGKPILCCTLSVNLIFSDMKHIVQMKEKKHVSKRLFHTLKDSLIKLAHTGAKKSGVCVK